MTVSVITPLYNSERTIEDTIMSVINQTYTDWEMIIVDDCSTDNSAAIVRRLSGNDKRIRLYSTDKPSGSPALPRNIGIENARGELIAFLDSDDIWYDKKLEEQVRYIEKNNYSFIYSNYEKMSHDGKRSGRYIIAKDKATYNSTLGSCEIPCLTAMIRKSIIGETRFVNKPKEDMIFWLEILKKGVTAYNCGEMHGIYRESDNSRSNNKIKMLKAQWKIIREIEKTGLLKSLYYITDYAVKGLIKYLK